MWDRLKRDTHNNNRRQDRDGGREMVHKEDIEKERQEIWIWIWRWQGGINEVI